MGRIVSAILVLVSLISQQSFISPANWVVGPEFIASQSHVLPLLGRKHPNSRDTPAVLNVTPMPSPGSHIGEVIRELYNGPLPSLPPPLSPTVLRNQTEHQWIEAQLCSRRRGRKKTCFDNWQWAMGRN